jgi:hypothetical protein
VHVTPFAYLLEAEFAAHQIASGIERFVTQIIRITHDGSARLQVDRMPRLRAWVTGSQVRRIRRATLARA